MKKALQVASVASMIDQFNRDNINILKKLGYEVHVASNFEFGSTCSQERVNQCKDELLHQDIRVYNLLFDRKIFNKSNIEVYKQLKKIIDENHYEIIHCHSPIGGVITRLAARKARKKGTKVIYTAHGFHFFKGAPLLNWLIYFPVEFFCSFFTDILIAINKEDYRLAKKVMKAKKIEYIPGVGVDVEKYQNLQVDKISKRKELGVPEDAVMLFSVGELNKNKNHATVIRAMAKNNNPKLHYCIAGRGNLELELKELASKLGVANQVHFLGFRSDVTELYKCSDIFCFPSYREGLSVSLMEAMSSGLPVICSDIRGNIDLIEQNKGGYLCNPGDVNTFEKSITLIVKDKAKRNEMGHHNQQKVKGFGTNLILNRIRDYYSH